MEKDLLEKSEDFNQTGEHTKVLCGASAYEKKFYLNEEFNSLPERIRTQGITHRCKNYAISTSGLFEEIQTDENIKYKDLSPIKFSSFRIPIKSRVCFCRI